MSTEKSSFLGDFLGLATVFSFRGDRLGDCCSTLHSTIDFLLTGDFSGVSTLQLVFGFLGDFRNPNGSSSVISSLLILGGLFSVVVSSSKFNFLGDFLRMISLTGFSTSFDSMFLICGFCGVTSEAAKLRKDKFN